MLFYSEQTMYHTLRYISAVLISTAYLAWSPNLQYVYGGCFIAILLFGIPHGAMDHKINVTLAPNRSVKVFVTRYIAVAIGFVAWWLLMPVKAFFAFLLLSAYHFGQELIEGYTQKVRSPAIYMLFGAIIIINPVVIRYNELGNIFTAFSGVGLPSVGHLTILLISSSLLLTGVVAALRMYLRKQIDKKQTYWLLTFMAYVTFSYTLLPFLLAFTLYFVLFHSANALHHQYRWMKQRQNQYSIKQFVVDLGPFSLVAIAGVGLLVSQIGISNWDKVFVVMFVFISALTLPHALLFHQFYNHRKAKSQKNILPV